MATDPRLFAASRRVASRRARLVSGVPTFVLIPGAGGSSWVWSRAAGLLTDAGHEAIAVDLPGDDETAGLDRYTELVVDAIGPRAEVVLVAGSLGGFTAPLVCERATVRELVLVNAMIPNPGETARDWWLHTGALEARESVGECIGEAAEGARDGRQVVGEAGGVHGGSSRSAVGAQRAVIPASGA